MQQTSSRQSQLCMFGKQMFNFGIGLRPVPLSEVGKKPVVVPQGKQNTSTDTKNPIHCHRETQNLARVLLVASHPLFQALMEEGSQEKIPFSEVEDMKRGSD